MSSWWKMGVLSIAFLVIAMFFLFNSLLLSGIFFALFLITLAGAFFSTLFKKDNARAEARVKERQARVRHRSKGARSKRQRGS